MVFCDQADFMDAFYAFSRQPAAKNSVEHGDTAVEPGSRGSGRTSAGSSAGSSRKAMPGNVKIPFYPLHSLKKSL